MVHIHIKLRNIFEKLHISEAHKVAVEMSRSCQMRDVELKPYFNDDYLVGGSEADGIDGIVFKYKNVNFTFYKTSDKYSIIFSIFQENDDEKAINCSVIMIDRIEKSADVSGISYDPKCFTQPQVHTFGPDISGKLLLKATLAFIEKMKNHYDIKYIKLRDNSRKPCKTVDDSIPFDTYLMFVSGHTWYGKYGFVPFNQISKKTNKEKLKLYTDNQKIIKNTKVKNTDIAKYIKKAIKKLKRKVLDDDVNDLVNKNKDKSIMEFMQIMSKNYNEFCGIFYYIHENLMKELGIFNLHGEVYWKEI